jgi:hypothetical protein
MSLAQTHGMRAIIILALVGLMGGVASANTAMMGWYKQRQQKVSPVRTTGTPTYLRQVTPKQKTKVVAPAEGDTQTVKTEPVKKDSSAELDNAPAQPEADTTKTTKTTDSQSSFIARLVKSIHAMGKSTSVKTAAKTAPQSVAPTPIWNRSVRANSPAALMTMRRANLITEQEYLAALRQMMR